MRRLKSLKPLVPSSPNPYDYIMSRNGKVIVAMSGGVDSSVAACLLKEEGYECVGVFMRVGADAGAGTEAGIEGLRDSGIKGADAEAHPPARRLKHGCCSVNDALDARAVAGRLGIPFYALNFQPDFERIIDYFVDEYAQARTPNPCVMCNIHLKFGKLLRYADMMEAEFVATGHYARIVRGKVGSWEGGKEAVGRAPRRCERGVTQGTDCVSSTADTAVASGRVYLARARNLAKDQSYVLFGIRRDDLARCLFPIGEIADKADVRRIAASLGLRVHDKPDSQEICFVPAGDYKELVRKRRPDTQRPGAVVDEDGHVLGTHDGIAGFTIGQRRGLGIAAGKPVYVTKLHVVNNTVTLGPREDLLSGGLIAEHVNWHVDPPEIGVWHPAAIKIRHMHTPAPGGICVSPGGVAGAPPDDGQRSAGDTAEARFNDPQPAVTPGQAAVFYDDDIVLGGGWIARAL